MEGQWSDTMEGHFYSLLRVGESGVSGEIGEVGEGWRKPEKRKNGRKILNVANS